MPFPLVPPRRHPHIIHGNGGGPNSGFPPRPPPCGAWPHAAGATSGANAGGATLTETADSGPGPAEAPAAAVSGPFDKAAIAARVAELAREISQALPEAFTVVGLLKGSFVFVDDLVRGRSAPAPSGQ